MVLLVQVALAVIILTGVVALACYLTDVTARGHEDSN